LIQAALAHGATVEEVVKSLRALSPAQRKTVLEEGARKEGETVWYTSMSLTDFPKIVGAFEKTVPFVKVRTNRLSQSSIMPKIDTETRAGHFAVDVVGSAPMEMWELKQRSHSTAYLSPELKAFPAGSYDPQGFWSSTEVTPLVLAFNTKLVPPNEAPRSYQDLLLSKWRAR
jgi:iron(III) transport system substrate-binding protein